MSEQKESIGHWDNGDMTTSINPQMPWQHVNNPPIERGTPLYLGLSLEAIRQIIREEIEATFLRADQHGLDRLMADIHRTEPLPEQEEIAAYLITLSLEEWDALIEKVNERRSGE